MTALALIQIAMQLLPTIEAGASELWSFISAVRTSTQQTGAWTQDMEAQFQATLISTKADPAWTKNT